MSLHMTKPTKWPLHPGKTSAQSDQSLRCPHEETLSPQLPNECTVKQTGGCPGWSESSLSVQITLLVLSWGSSYINWSEYQSTLTLCEPPHDKTNKMSVRLAKTQISPVWSESSLCAQWVAKDPSFLHADSEDSDQTGRMPRLIWVFAGHTCHFGDFVMRWLMSYLFPNIGSPWPMW